MNKLHDLALSGFVFVGKYITSGYFLKKIITNTKKLHTEGFSYLGKMNQTVKIHRNTKKYNQNSHILVVSCPFQGHASPLIKISHQLTKFGSRVTFLTTDLTHTLIASAMAKSENWNHGIRVVAIPDGLELEEDKKDQKKLHEAVQKMMPGYLEDLLKKTNQSHKGNDRISGVIIDSPLAWMLEIPKKMGLKTTIFWCSTPGCLALGLKIPQLIEAKFIDNDGTPLKNENLQLLPNMPAMAITDFTWYLPGDINKQKEIFHVIKGIIHHMKKADWIICNWIQELDPAACKLTPNLLSIGPLLANGQSTGSFVSEDSTCLTWLDKQPKNSVVYVAFGSTSRFNKQQLDELAKGLELMNRPYLWVAWSGLTDVSFPDYTNDFTERGKIVEWAPQEMVLGHPSTACFITHCGWSSFMESLSMGVPLVCWPYFADQMYTQTCICDAWKVGIGLKPNESGIIPRHEIKLKVDELVSDGIIKENAERLKAIATKSINKGGSSLTNFEYLIQQMQS